MAGLFTMNDDDLNSTELQFSVKVMNNQTGEIIEIEINSAVRAAEALQELKASKQAIEKAIKLINARLDNYLGQDDETTLANGMTVKRVHRLRTEWDVEQLKKFLDDDQINLVTTVKKTDAKNMLKELIERGHVEPMAIKYLDETAIPLPTTPFIEVR